MKLLDLGVGAKELLEAFAAVLVANDPDFPLPPNQYVGAGEIPWDGEGLYVYLSGGLTGQVGAPVSTQVPSPHQVSTVAFYVMLVRGVETLGYWAGGNIDIPSNNVLSFEGERAISDVGALIAAARSIQAQKLVTRMATGFQIGQVTPVGPQGGMAAVRLELTVSIDGS